MFFSCVYVSFFPFIYLFFPFLYVTKLFKIRYLCNALAHAPVYSCTCVYASVCVMRVDVITYTYLARIPLVYERVAYDFFFGYYYICICMYVCTYPHVCVFIYVCMCVWIPTCQSIGTEEWTKTERNETIAKEGSRQAASSSSTPGLETELARGPFRSTPPRLFSHYYLPSQPIPQTSPLQPPRTP